MLSADMLLNEAALLSILESGHSRIPVHKPGNRSVDVLSLIIYAHDARPSRYFFDVC